MTKDQVYSNRQERVKPSEVTNVSGSKFVGATFLYLTLALFITFAVIFTLGATLKYALYKGNDVSADIFVKFFIGGLIAYIPVMIWVNVAACRQGKTVGVAFFAYSIVMGVLLSVLCLLDIWTIVIAFGTTCLTFAVMALIAWTSKRDLSGLGVFGFGLLMGALIISLFNLILFFIVGFQPLYWLVSYLFFFAILVLTVFDLNRVKKIAQSGNGTTNLAIWCALNLYVDFIYIFIRIVSIVASIRNK